MDKELVYGNLEKSLSKLNNKHLQDALDKVCEIIKERIKGNLEIYVDIDQQEISFNVHIDYDDRYFSQRISFDDLLRFDNNPYKFVNSFMDTIEDYYMCKIFN